MLIIDKQIEIGIFFASNSDKRFAEFPLELGGIDELTMISNVMSNIPVVHVELVDVYNLANMLPIHDSAVMRVVITSQLGVTNNYNFRIFSVDKHIDNNTKKYTIEGYLDYPRFLTETTNKAYKGTASSIFTEIAKDIGFIPKVVTTADSQIWYGGNKTYVEFLDYISERAYKPDAIICWCVDLQGRLVLADFNEFSSDPPVLSYGIVPQDDNSISIHDFEIENISSFGNILGGYKRSMIVQSVDTEVNEISKYSIRHKAIQMERNIDVADTIATGYVEYSPIHFTTQVHAKYFNSLYTNSRGSLANLVGVSVQSQFYTGVSLLDTIRLRLDSESGISGNTIPQENPYNGIYKVTGKIISVKGVNYSDTIYLTREGINQ